MAVSKIKQESKEFRHDNDTNVIFQRMKASKCPTDELSLMNRAIVNPGDFYNNDDKYIDLSTGPGQHFVFAIERSPEGKSS